MQNRARFWMLGVLCVMLVSAPFIVWGQSGSSPWENFNQTGMNAYQQGNYAEAAKQFLAALQEAEKFGPEDPRLATSLHNLAALYGAQGRYGEAEPLYQRVLAISEKALGPQHPNLGETIENYARLLRTMGREDEAEKMEARAKAIRAKNPQ